jgi:hypothetical protein
MRYDEARGLMKRAAEENSWEKEACDPTGS